MISPRINSLFSSAQSGTNLDKAIQEVDSALSAERDPDDSLLFDFKIKGLSTQQLSSELKNYKVTLDSFIQDYLTKNQYVPKEVRKAYLDKISEADSIKELTKIRSEVKKEVQDAEYLIKTLSAVENAIDSSSLDDSTKKQLKKQSRSISSIFHKSGDINNSQIKALVTAAKSFKDEEGNSQVSIDNESALTSAVDRRVQNNVNEAARGRVEKAVDKYSTSNGRDYSKDKTVRSFKRGETSAQDLISYFKSQGDDTSDLESTLTDALSKDSAIANVFKDSLDSLALDLNTNSMFEYEQVRQEYSKSNLTMEEMSIRLESILGETESSVQAISRMNSQLSVIEENTDKGKLSNAEQILNQNRLEQEEENSSKLSELLGVMKGGTSRAVTKSVLGGSEDAEQLGADAANSMMDMMGGGDVSRDKDGKKSRSRRTKGKGGLVKNLLSKGGGLAKSAMKAAGPLAAVASLGMGAYNYSQAESGAEREEAVGSATGSATGAVIGGALGTLLGPIGTVAGAAIGSYVGEKAGSWFSKMFQDPEDLVPDEVKKQGPKSEINYIDKNLLPKMQQSIQADDGDYDEDDIKDMLSYRKSLINKLSSGVTDEEKRKILKLKEQGLDSPEHISIATGIDPEKVKQQLSGESNQVLGDQTSQKSKKYDAGTRLNKENMDSKENTKPPATYVTTTNNNYGSSEGSNDTSIRDMRLFSLASRI